MFCPWCFFRNAFTEVPRPIAVKLCHMIGNWLNCITQIQKFGRRSPQKNWGPETCKISVDFIQPLTLTANISGTSQDIKNRQTNVSSCVLRKRSGELWSTNYSNGTKSPKKFNSENLKFGLKFSVWAPTTSGLVGLSSRNFSRRRSARQGWYNSYYFWKARPLKFGRANIRRDFWKWTWVFDSHLTIWMMWYTAQVKSKAQATEFKCIGTYIIGIFCINKTAKRQRRPSVRIESLFSCYQ